MGLLFRLNKNFKLKDIEIIDAKDKLDNTITRSRTRYIKDDI